MEEEIPIENSPLTAEEELVIANFSQSEQQLVDSTILANCSERWLKVARVAGMSRDALQNYYPALSCSFYAERIVGLVEKENWFQKVIFYTCDLVRCV